MSPRFVLFAKRTITAAVLFYYSSMHLLYFYVYFIIFVYKYLRSSNRYLALLCAIRLIALAFSAPSFFPLEYLL